MASFIKPVLILRCQQILSRSLKAHIQSRKLPAVCCSTSNEGSTKPKHDDSSFMSKDPLPIFLNEKTQSILQKITGFDLEKIFRPKKIVLKNPKYKLMVQEELEKAQAIATEEGKARLQMPPVMKAEKDFSDVTISNDTHLDKLKKHKIVFTDISLEVKHKKRFIVVREPSGRLRHASVDERTRLIQTYFPLKERKIVSPRMFEGEHLEEFVSCKNLKRECGIATEATVHWCNYIRDIMAEYFFANPVRLGGVGHIIEIDESKLLEKGSFEYILDKACVQFESDHPEYIRVTQKTYEFIRQISAFDTLRSTRHFGPMTFYYVWYDKVDRLLIEMIERNQISDAADVVRLYNIIHADSNCAQTSLDVDNDLDLLKIFCIANSTEKHRLELTLQVYEDKLNVEERQESSVS